MERVVVQVRVTPGERGLWKRAAMDHGLSVSEWVRAACNAEANAVLPPVGAAVTSKPTLRCTVEQLEAVLSHDTALKQQFYEPIGGVKDGQHWDHRHVASFRGPDPKVKPKR